MDLSELSGAFVGGLAGILYATGVLRSTMIGLSITLGPSALLAYMALFLAVGIGFGLVSMIVRWTSRPHRAALAFGIALATAALPGELMGGGITGFLFWIPWTLLTLLLLYLGASVPGRLVKHS